MKKTTIFQIVRFAMSVTVFFMGWAMRSNSGNSAEVRAYGGILIAISLFGLVTSVLSLVKGNDEPPASGSAKKK